LSDFAFAEPGWAYALVTALALVIAVVWLERRGRGAVSQLVGPRLYGALVKQPPAWRRNARPALLALCLLAIVVALLRPQWGMRYESATRASADIMICLDISRSMLAEDVAPSRVERAKAEIVDLLGFLEGDQVGLIAFAGRATVLSPMTPDFGFLRLVLGSAGPGSALRGGTRLEEPLRKALASFDVASAAARVILLITDGEDLDSFPVEAARDAAQAGVRILAIGIGSEAGSQIYVTDPRTGARTLVRDASGAPVTSRLDGATLREIVAVTRGVYVPAGTGVLDLAAIHREHIQPLLRGEAAQRGRAAREEGYQWALLVALVSLVAAAWVASTAASSTPTMPVVRAPHRAVAAHSTARAAGAARRSPAASAQAVAMLLAASLVAWSGRAGAQERESDAGAPVSDPAAPAPAAGGAPEPAEPDLGGEDAAVSSQTPREQYNAGVAALSAGSLEDAERALRGSRTEGADDPELRFRATYNLGYALAMRARATREADGKQALSLLYRAADRLGDAVRQRPDDVAARHNLEVVLREALLLADALAQERAPTLEASLEALAAGEREIAERIAGLLAAADGAPDAVRRRALREVASSQRLLLADADALASQVESERTRLEATPEADREPEARARLGQLAGIDTHLLRARQRMGQARSQLRLQQRERAYRRAVGAIGSVERARDQLRDPGKVLSRVLRDAMGNAAMLAALAAAEASGSPEAGDVAAATPEVPAGDGEDARRDRSPATGAASAASAPAWLTPELLQQVQEDIAERSEEVRARLAAALPPAPAQTGQHAQVAEALPALERAAGAFGRSAAKLGGRALRPALAAAAEGIAALREAREMLLDVKGLIEVVHADQGAVQEALSVDVPSGAEDALLRTLRQSQARNLARTGRLARLLGRDAAALEASAPAAAGAGPPAASPPRGDPDQAAQRKRLAAASAIVGQVREEMQAAGSALGRHATPRQAARAASERALAYTGLLRRLFFTVTELLQDTRDRQQELADRTRDALAGEAPAASPIAPSGSPMKALETVQRELAGLGQEIAAALEEQANAGVGPGAAPAVRQGEADPEQVTDVLLRAAEHVTTAREAMLEAAEQLAVAEPARAPLRAGQSTALEELSKALALMVPPEEQPQQGDPGSQQQPQGGSGGERGDPGDERDAEQILQAVRDREAQRARERAGRAAAGGETVERDW
jgi:Ca-activated chloride channel family protein